MDPNTFAAMMGQLAGAIAPGSTGAALGQFGAQMGQAGTISQKQDQQKQQLIKILQGLTPEEYDTTGVKINPETGQLSISGAPAVNKRVLGSTSPTAEELDRGQVISNGPAANEGITPGGQNGINSPFTGNREISTAGLSPEQVAGLGAADQDTIKTVLNVLFKNREYGLAKRAANIQERQQVIEEDKYAKAVQNNKLIQADLAKLDQFTPETISTAPAGVLARIQPTSISSMLQVSERIIAGKAKPINKESSADERIMAAAVAQNPENPFESQVFKMALALSGKGKKETDENLYTKAVEIQSKNRMFQILKPAEQEAKIEETVKLLKKGQRQPTTVAPVTPTTTPGATRLKDPLLDQAWNEWQQTKKQ
jgi:hypothetical protein